MSGTDRLAQAVRLMRLQARAGLVAGPGLAAVYGFFAARRGSSVVGWVVLALLAAAVSGAVLLAAAAVERTGRTRPGVLVEFGVIAVGAWALPLAPLTIAAPAFVLYLLGRTYPQ